MTTKVKKKSKPRIEIDIATYNLLYQISRLLITANELPCKDGLKKAWETFSKRVKIESPIHEDIDTQD